MTTPSATAGFVHLHTHSEYSPVDSLAKVKDLVAAAVADGNTALAINDHGTLGGIWKLGKYARAAGIKPIAGCLLAGQEIVTSDGIKNVEDVHVGDSVLTHKGRYRPVLSTMARRHVGRAYRIHLAGRYGRQLLLTEEHPILIRTRDGRVEWVKPGEIVAGRHGNHGGTRDWNSWVCLPKLRGEQVSLNTADYLPSGEGWSTKQGHVARSYPSKFRGEENWASVPASITLDAELAYFLGLYAAEGSLHRRVLASGEEFTGKLAFALHATETHLAERIEAVAVRFGTQATVRPRFRPMGDNGVEVVFSCLPLAHLVARTVGCGSWKKRVPAEVMRSPRDVREAFVQGLVDGDGKTPGIASNPGGSAMVKVVSRDLAWGLRTLLADMGHFVGVGESAGEPTNTKTRRRAYVVCYNPNRAWARTLEDDDFVYRPVREVEPADLDAEVFNFEVEEDNSYVSDFVLHNCEAYLAIGDRFEHNTVTVEDDDADPDVDGVRGKKVKKYEHLTLLAATPEGWANLVAMGNESQESFWGKPRIDYDLLAKYGTGILVLTGCLGGPVAGPLSRGNRAEAVANLHRLIGCVGPDNVFIEVMDHGIEAQILIMDEIRSVAEEVGLPLVATNDSHYMHADQKDAHEAWLAVGTKKVKADAVRFRFHGTGHHLRTEAEMRALQGGADWWQKACDQTVAIAARVADDVLPVPHLRLPVFPCPDGFPDSATYLKHLVREGAFKRYGPDPTRPDRLPTLVNDRLKFEFPVIFNAGIADYFLIVWDLIAWARSDRGYPTQEFPDGEPGKKVPIRVGPGRGSAAGSVISYCLWIVGVDPLANNLLFERFLNPERTGMPDIDVDFEKGRRPEVLRYIEHRYGRGMVARIGTFGVAATRRALLDASKFLGVTGLGTKLSPLVPNGPGGKPISLAALADTKDQSGDAFRAALSDAGASAAGVLELAGAFEGVTKLEGIHACGTLISDEPMAPLAPMRRDRAKGATDEDLLVTVWDGKDTEDYGFLKMDVLGLRNLDVISATVRFIAEQTGEVIDPDSLAPGNPDDAERDNKTWDLIGSGRTAGVFQLESSGMTQLAESVAPTSLNDLTALVALYRPGPMAAKMHEHYAARKHGHEPISYDYLTTDPGEQTAIASVLGDTYGVVAYQEQLMRLGGVVAGLNPGMRNKLQKAFSKKNVAMMAEVKEAMFAGGLAGEGTSGLAFSSGTLERLWVTFEGSAAYLFNQSHACAYGFVSYQTAYLKANWPVLYGAAILAVTDDDDKRLLAIRSLQVEGIEILAPDINRSGVATAPDGDAVRLGLSEVKGVGKDAVHVVAERDARGPFTSMTDVITRVRVPNVSKSGVTTIGAIAVNKVAALVEAGAFDEFGPRKGLSMILRAVRATPEATPDTGEWGVLERSARQRQRLGLSTGPHPLVALGTQVAAYRERGHKPTSVQNVHLSNDGDWVTLLGVLSGWSEKAYSRGRMVSLTLEGSKGSVEGVMWDEDRASVGEPPVVGTLVTLSGPVRVRLVETEQVGEDGETVTDSFERRDLTVKRVTRVPVDDPCTTSLPTVGALVLPERVTPAPAPVARPVPAVVAAPVAVAGDDDAWGEWFEPDATEPPQDEYDFGPEPPQDETEPVPEGYVDPEPSRVPLPESARVRHLHVAVPTPSVIRLTCASGAVTHPDLLAAAVAFDLPPGFCTAGGGRSVLTTAAGHSVEVLIGAHQPTGAAHLSLQEAGWTAAPVPQSAAA